MSDPNKLRWRCRRGTLELDLMLQRYLDCRYLAADAEERQAFLQLLELEDSALLRYFMGERPCDDRRFAGLIDNIRALPSSFPDIRPP